ncbi:MAG: hypothetical protein ACR2G5_13175 [Pyrinomonadaceae bacterium]
MQNRAIPQRWTGSNGKRARMQPLLPHNMRILRSRYIFRYKVTVKNDSSKTIKSVDWDYVFLDASTETEINRQQFTSEEKISPGKIKELNIIVARSPTMAISVNALSKNERDGLNEQVVVMRIDYADGSVWQRP